MRPLKIQATTYDADAPTLCRETIATSDGTGRPSVLKGDPALATALGDAVERFDANRGRLGFDTAARSLVVEACAAAGVAPPRPGSPVLVELRTPGRQPEFAIVAAPPERRAAPPPRSELVVLRDENVSQTCNRLLQAGMSYAVAMATASSLHGERATKTTRSRFVGT